MFDRIFIHTLNSASAVRIMWRNDLRAAKRVYCRRATPMGRRLIRSHIICLQEDLFAACGASNFLTCRSTEVMECLQGAIRESDPYLRRFLELRMADSIESDVSLVLESQRFTKDFTARTAIFLTRGPFFSILRKRFQYPRVEFVPVYDGGIWKRRVGIGLRWQRKVVQAVGATLRSIVQHATLQDLGPSVSVYSHGGGYAWEQRHDLFWLSDGSAFPPVIFEYPSTSYPCSPQYIQALVQRGIRIIETHGGAQQYGESQVWQPGYRFLLGALRNFGMFMWRCCQPALWCHSLTRWCVFHAFDFANLVQERRDYYHTYHVRAELKIGLPTEHEAALSAALESVGGISCATQYSIRSNHLHGCTSTSTFHLYLGAFCHNWPFPFLARYNIANGYLYKRTHATRAANVAALRERLVSAGVRRSVCFFDEQLEERSVYESAMPVYKYLLERITRESDFGVVLKPKKNTTVDILGREYRKLFQEAMTTGRLLVLDWLYFPADVGAAVDLTLGILGTASLEAAIVGCRAIHLLCQNHLPEFFRVIQDEIFQTPDEYIRAIEQFFRGTEMAALGHHPEIFLRQVDHYRDEECSTRIQHILGGYIHALRDGKEAAIALEEVVTSFARRWPMVLLGENSGRWLPPFQTDIVPVQQCASSGI